MATVVTDRTKAADWGDVSAVGRRRSASLRFEAVAFFFALHIPLALMMSRYPWFAALHAYTTVLVGISWALSKGSPHRGVNIVAYIAGAEVLWRMTSAPVFWEFGKYATVAVLFFAIQRKRPLRPTTFPVAYFALLLPSVMLTVANSPVWRIRHELSFNLSGPLALAVCVAFFSRVRLSRSEIQRIIVACLGPVAGMVTIIVLGISRLESHTFAGGSAAATSGGFGPNQVSSMLGFAAILALMMVLLFLPRKQTVLKYAFGGVAIALAGLSALTFSRSGLYLTTMSGAVGAMFLLRGARSRFALLTTVCLVCVVAKFIALPQLDTFTGGALTKRFSDTHLTGRAEIMQADLSIWREHPILGVGPGMAPVHRAAFFKAAAAHSEFTRMLAEHGILGFAAGTLLMIAGWRAVQRAKTIKHRAFVASLVAFALLLMASNAMRLVLPGFAFGLAFASFKE